MVKYSDKQKDDSNEECCDRDEESGFEVDGE